MKRFRFKKIDAFTGPRSPGNPAGCVWLEGSGGIADGEMLEIARQMKGFVSEVAFLIPEGEGFSLRYFSSEREVDFCGHATIAAAYDYFTSDPSRQEHGSLPLRVGGSSLEAYNDLAGSGSVFIAAPEPTHLPMGIHIDDITRALGIAGADIDSRYRISLVRCGLAALLVPMRRANALTDVLPDIETLGSFCGQNGVDIVVLFTDDKILPGSDFRTRVFAPRFGYLEDPATGSGNAALGSMLLKDGFWQGGELTIEQGTSYRDPNIVKLRTARDGDRLRVQFGGAATVRIDGYYLLP